MNYYLLLVDLLEFVRNSSKNLNFSSSDRFRNFSQSIQIAIDILRCQEVEDNIESECVFKDVQ